MLKLTRRCISFLLLTIILLPTTAFASSTLEQHITIPDSIGTVTKIIGTPLGETQTEYPIHPFSSGTFPGKIISVSTTPTRSGNTVYPNLQVQIMGAAVVTAYVELQQYDNGSWISIGTTSGQSYVNRYFDFNPGRSANNGSTYRFVFIVSTNGGGFDEYYMVGREFYL